MSEKHGTWCGNPGCTARHKPTLFGAEGECSMTVAEPTAQEQEQLVASLFDSEPHLPNQLQPEPSLRHIIKHYYTSHDIVTSVAERLTQEYIDALREKGDV